MITPNDALIAAVLERNSRTLTGSPDQSTDDETRPVENGVESLSRCLAESMQTVFQTMCGMAIEADVSESAEGQSHHVSGIISLSGQMKATVVFSMHQDVVFAAAEGMLGIRPTEFDADVVDLVGELSNMVVGNAKERLKMQGVSLGLPTVVLGGHHRIAYRSNVVITMLKFTSQHGSLVIEFGIA